MKLRYWLCAILLLVLVWAVFVAIPKSTKQAAENPTLNDPSSVDVSFSNITLIPADRELELQGWWMPAASSLQRGG